MKTASLALLVLAALWAAPPLRSAEPEADPPPPAAPPPEAETQAPANGELRLNFRGAPLDLVLDYLSEAAGFIINKQTEVRGTIDAWSKQPVTREEAVEILNSVLRKNGYAVTRNGRILTILKLDEVKTADLDIIPGADPDDVEKSDEVVTQIIPVRYANAAQLMNNLQVLLPTSATLTANESANSLILVATKTDIRRMLKIIRALDTSIASVSSIKVFPLRYADAKTLATTIQPLFAQPATAGGQGNRAAQFFNMMRGGPGGGGPPGQGGGAGASTGAGVNTAATRVVAAADENSNSLIVGASEELMAAITDMVEQLDVPVSDVVELRVFRLTNADPRELADQLATLFPDETRSGQNNQNRGRFFGGPGMPPGMGGQTTGTSTRARQLARVVAVADPRTASLIVSASVELMPQIAEMVARLDDSPAKKEQVAVYELKNANPQDVYQVLQDLFNRNNTMRANNANSRNSMLGQNNPLNQRATQQQNQSGAGNTRFGSGSTRTGGGAFQ